jgi:hypothetical protein
MTRKKKKNIYELYFSRLMGLLRSWFNEYDLCVLLKNISYFLNI